MTKNNNFFNIFVKKCLLAKFLFTIVILVCFFSSKAQVATYSNEFLNIGVDAASMAKGNAVVASTSGVCSGYLNPAGLTSMEKRFEASAMHANYFSGLAQYDYFGFSYKATDSLMLGLSAIRFGVDDIPNTLNLVDADGNIDYDRITYFSVADYALLLSLSKKSKIQGLAWGGSVKLIYRQQGEFASAYGFGFDMGAQYKLKKWKFGAMLRDATSTFNMWIFKKELFEEVFVATGNEVPENSLELTAPKLLLGFARGFTFNEKLKLLAEIDFDVHFDGEHHSMIAAKPLSIDPHFGLEISYLKNIFLRAGVDRFQVVNDFDNTTKFTFQPSLGVGFSLFNFSLDYALIDVGDLTVAPVSHIFSLKYSFGM